MARHREELDEKDPPVQEGRQTFVRPWFQLYDMLGRPWAVVLVRSQEADRLARC